MKPGEHYGEGSYDRHLKEITGGEVMLAL